MSVGFIPKQDEYSPGWWVIFPSFLSRYVTVFCLLAINTSHSCCFSLHVNIFSASFQASNPHHPPLKAVGLEHIFFALHLIPGKANSSWRTRWSYENSTQKPMRKRWRLKSLAEQILNGTTARSELLELHVCTNKYRKLWKSNLVGGLEHFLLFHILGTIIPTVFHIFQRGRYTTNQLG